MVDWVGTEEEEDAVEDELDFGDLEFVWVESERLGLPALALGANRHWVPLAEQLWHAGLSGDMIHRIFLL